jgi:hypothetical protein
MPIRKTITVAYPDEPYKTTTDAGKTFEMTYTGPRYILCQVDRDDDQVREAGRGDKADARELDPAGYEQDDYDYIVIDASESDAMCLRAAYMTDEYEHADIADYEETITDANGDTSTYNHIYEGTTGMLPNIYWADSLYYNHETSTWSGPNFREHVNTRESTVQSYANIAACMRRALADSNQTFTDEERTLMTNHCTWLENVDTTYAGINHWKWPFPETVMPYYFDPDTDTA